MIALSYFDTVHALAQQVVISGGLSFSFSPTPDMCCSPYMVVSRVHGDRLHDFAPAGRGEMFQVQNVVKALVRGCEI